MWARLVARQAARAVREGEDLFGAGAADDAKESFERAVAILGRWIGPGSSPRSLPEPVAATGARARIGLGRACLSCGETTRAIAELADARRLQPDSADAVYWSGCAQAHGDDHESAESSFSEAIRHDPARGAPFAQRAMSRLRLGRRADAVEDLVAADRLGGLAGTQSVLLAVLLIRDRRWAEAESLLTRIPRGGADPRQEGLLALCQEALGHKAAARDTLTRACARGVPEPWILFRRGLLASRMRDYQAAAISWAALQARYPYPGLAPVLSRTVTAAARSLAGEGGTEEAVALLRQFADHLLPDDDADLMITRLHLAAHARRDAGAAGHGLIREQAAAVLAASPDEPIARYVIGVLESLAGRPDSAVAALGSADGAATRTGALEAVPELAERTMLAEALCRLSVPPAAVGDPSDPQQERGAGLLARLGSDDRSAVRGPANRALAAWHAHGGRWSDAADILLQLDRSGSGPSALRDTRMLTECLFRAERHQEVLGVPGIAGEPLLWQALVHLGRQDVNAAVTLLRDTVIPPTPEWERPRQELIAALSRSSVRQAERGAWPTAATVVRIRRDLARESGRTTASAEQARRDALFLMLGGDRRSALDTLAAASRQDPFDAATTHLSAVMQLHRASDEADTTDFGRRSLGAWATLLLDDDYWARWLARVEARYRITLPSGSPAAIKERLGELLRDTVHSGAWRREISAARLLADRGGLPLDGGHLVCGPMWLRDLGVERDFGAFLDGLESSDESLPTALWDMLDAIGLKPPDLGARPTTGDLTRMRRLFSCLGLAQVELDEGRPHQALELVAEASCDESFLSFAALNPAYAVADGRRRCAQDSARLSADAWLAVGRTAIAKETVDLDEVGQAWRSALGCAVDKRNRTAVESDLATVVLGKLATLRNRISDVRRHGNDLRMAEPLATAVALLDDAHGLCTSSARDRIQGQLAALLTDRGVWTANHYPERLPEVVEDLSRAVLLNPYLARAQLNLGRASRMLAARKLGEGDALESLRLLDQAVESLQRGLDRKRADVEFAKELEAVTQERNLLLDGFGMRLMTGGVGNGRPGTGELSRVLLASLSDDVRR